jgi:hypothetical protein
MVLSNAVASGLERERRREISLMWIKGRMRREAQSCPVSNIDEVAQSGSDDRVRHFHRHGDLHHWFCVAVAPRATEKEKEKRSPFEKGD